MFYIEVSTDDGSGSAVVVEFDTPEGKVVSDLLTDYALSFLREREREDDRMAKIKSGKLSLPQTSSSSNKIGSINKSKSSDSSDSSLKRRSSKGAGATSSPAPASIQQSTPKPPPPVQSSRPTSTRVISPPVHLPVPPVSAMKGMKLSSANATQTKKREAAAVKIQALFRGFSLRNEWAREDAAILIQCVFRGFLGRVKLGKMIERMIQAGEI